jgi:hypothetical protein
METIKIYVFKESIQTVTELLSKEGLAWSSRHQPNGVIMNSAEILNVVVNATAWVSIATVLVTFIKAKHGRKVIITTKDNKVIHAEGMTHNEFEIILKQAASLTVFDPNNPSATYDDKGTSIQN